MTNTFTTAEFDGANDVALLASIDRLVAAQWSIAADHEVLGPVLSGTAALEPLGALLALIGDEGQLRRAAALSAAPHLDGVFNTFEPGRLDCITAAIASQAAVWLRTSPDEQLNLALGAEHAGVGSWAAVPLRSGDEVIGVLATAFAKPLVFDEGQRSILLALARLTALALTSGFADGPPSMRDITRERERLARDLHDGVVQDVIASAMNLATIVPLVSDAVRPRLERIIENHDVIVRELRKTIFSLSASEHTDIAPSHELVAVADEAESMLGFRPVLHLDGPVDAIDPVTLGHLRLALHEMLANVARHAVAGHVDVTVTVTECAITATVIDDGLGMAPHTRRGNGLDNLAHRAHQLGGRCEFSSGSRGGAIVRWTVPRHPISHNGTSAEKEPK